GLLVFERSLGTPAAETALLPLQRSGTTRPRRTIPPLVPLRSGTTLATTTRPLVPVRSQTTKPPPKTQPMVLKRSLATRPVSATRPPVLKRSSATPPSPTSLALVIPPAVLARFNPAAPAPFIAARGMQPSLSPIRVAATPPWLRALCLVTTGDTTTLHCVLTLA